MSEQYYQLAVEPNDPNRHMSPTWNILCRPRHLKERVAQLERDERVMVTRVYNELAQEVPPKDWRP